MFEKIIGNEKIKQELLQTLKNNKLSHSYLFVGTEGIGKKLIGTEFAKGMLCLNGNIPCNSCKSCLEFESSNHPDFKIIEPDGLSFKIDQIRQIQRKIIEAPIVSEKKVYILDDAHLMTIEAQNCLLKTLEEPPEYAIIILIGNMESNFLSTIKSRCAIIKFQDLADDEIKEFIKNKYSIQIKDEVLKVLGGSIGKAEKYEQNQELYNLLLDILENIEKNNLIDFLKKAELIYNYSNEKFEILDNINIILFNKSKEDKRFLKCIDIVEETKKRLSANGNFNMCIDNMLFSIWEEIH